MYVPDGIGGAFRVIPTTNNMEASIGLYGYTNQRATAANDMWSLGQNCWSENGFSIGTPSTHACFNIFLYWMC
jgi:hypothetical protein